jgi:hypothetical protein
MKVPLEIADQVAKLRAQADELEARAASPEFRSPLKVCVKVARTLRLPDDSFEKLELFVEDFCLPETREDVLSRLQSALIQRVDDHAHARRGQVVSKSGPQVRIISKETEAADVPFEE